VPDVQKLIKAVNDTMPDTQGGMIKNIADTPSPTPRSSSGTLDALGCRDVSESSSRGLNDAVPEGAPS